MVLETLRFKSNINVESSYSSVSVGACNSTIEISVVEGDLENGQLFAEWIVESPTFESHEEIGMWTENGELMGYDGVFELPVQILDCLESKGIDVSEMR